MSSPKLDNRSKELRQSILRMLAGGRRGHLASALSLVEILRVLYDEVLTFRPHEPHWAQRDRLILSKGHGCMALYALLGDKGFFSLDEYDRFCRPGGILGGHPDHRKVPGVEASTGSLGHGLSIGVGVALNARLRGLDYRTYVILGDGECNEGSVWEAAMCAAKHGLSSLTAIIDYNKVQSYSTTAEVQELEPFLDKWTSFGFLASEVDGHDVTALHKALTDPSPHERPRALICHTTKGRGITNIEGDLSWHHKSRVSDEMIDMLRMGLED